jgi:hypothetical protein
LDRFGGGFGRARAVVLAVPTSPRLAPFYEG